MNKFALDFRTDNAAFADNEKAEIVRILRDVADRIEANPSSSGLAGMIRDINGNTVGDYGMTDPDDD